MAGALRRHEDDGIHQNIQHALDLASAFQAYGIKAEAVWGDDPDRDSKIERHKAGQFDVMMNAQLTIEGYDDPTIRWVILATPDGAHCGTHRR